MKFYSTECGMPRINSIGKGKVVEMVTNKQATKRHLKNEMKSPSFNLATQTIDQTPLKIMTHFNLR